MERISIMGCPGAGKSTFAIALGQVLGIRVLHLDLHFWSPDIRELPQPAREQALEACLAQPRYVLDGGYPWTYARRIEACDTLIWLCIPPHQRLWNMLRRHWMRGERLGQHRADATSQSRVPRLHALHLIGRQQHRDEWHLEPVFARPPPGKRLIRLRSRAEAQAFLHSLQK